MFMIITMMIIYASNYNINYCYVSPSQEYDQHSNCPYIYHQPLKAGKFRLVFPTKLYGGVGSQGSRRFPPFPLRNP